MDIKEKINEISDYFKNKVLEGDYEFISADEHKAIISINNYEFKIWIANNVKDRFDFYYYDEKEVLKPKFGTQKERLKAYKIMKPMIDSYKEAILKKEKQAKIKELQKELEELNNK